MKLLTTTEGKVLLLLCKDFTTDYNANSLANRLGITRRGAINVVKALKREELVVGKRYGKAVFYKADLTSHYVKEIVKTLLMTETKQHMQRWIHQFEKLLAVADAVIIFGSAVQNYSKARDIDLLVVFKGKNLNAARRIIEQENRSSAKPIHVVWQSPQDFISNIKKLDPVLINALKFGYVLCGYNLIVQIILQTQLKYGSFSIPKPEPR
ncbi:MAG: hypothetical protein AABW64_02185 [Nanoarchaeota archaeon]